jgi:hypothetical protein
MSLEIPAFSQPSMISHLSESSEMEKNKEETKVQDMAYSRFVELRIVDHFIAIDRRIKISKNLSDEEKIQTCQKVIKEICKVEDVVAVSFPIRFREYVMQGHETREHVTPDKLWLVNESLPAEQKKCLQSSCHIHPSLMKGVKNTCYVAFGEGKLYRFNFATKCEGKLISLLGDSTFNPIIWDINSDQIKALQSQALTEESILTQYGNRALVCSTLGAAEAKMDYLDEELTRLFVTTQYEKTLEK